MAKQWKQGRGKLGAFAPLHGSWVAEATSEMGPVRCHRKLEPMLGATLLRLDVRWEIGAGGSSRLYEELAIIGVGDDGLVGFWSFTSDGKRSQGRLADVTDIHPEAIGFEAEMPYPVHEPRVALRGPREPHLDPGASSAPRRLRWVVDGRRWSGRGSWSGSSHRG